jgi:hypothetical protein
MEHEPRCAICGGDPEDGHHLTGRGPDGEYLDPNLIADLCHDDHELAGEDLRQDGLEKPLAGTTIVERVSYQLHRVGVFLARVAEEVPPFRWVASLAVAVRNWADELNRFTSALDDWDAGWRTAGGAS